VGDAYTGRTGHTKIMTKRPIHVMVDDDIYEEFHAWCLEHGTNPTSRARELIIEHNQKHRKKPEEKPQQGAAKTFFLNEQHTTHITKAQAKKERAEKRRR
jgi:hypothetical protein